MFQSEPLYKLDYEVKTGLAAGYRVTWTKDSFDQHAMEGRHPELNDEPNFVSATVIEALEKGQIYEDVRKDGAGKLTKRSEALIFYHELKSREFDLVSNGKVIKTTRYYVKIVANKSSKWFAKRLVISTAFITPSAPEISICQPKKSI
jgi:hypothetical protein